MSLLVRDLVKMGEIQLNKVGIESAKYEAEYIYCHMKNYSRSKFLLMWAKAVDELVVEKYLGLIEKRTTRVPLQHITGETEFMDGIFTVRPNVLIPRFETESVCLEGEKLLKPKSTVLDLCCGSGVIGISLAMRNNIKLTLSDYSNDAVELTKENLERNGVKGEVVKGDLFGGVSNKKFNMIISNPPYIRTDIIPTLQVEVREYDPISALDGGEDGLDFYRRIIDEAPEYLKKEGVLVLEIGHDQGEDVSAIMINNGSYENIRVTKDLAGLDRVVTGNLIKKGMFR
ncbi:MAG: peptide chain release factor N(5)-glutamine methyltransferase [Anaerovoracaceae bacterium]